MSNYKIESLDAALDAGNTSKLRRRGTEATIDDKRTWRAGRRHFAAEIIAAMPVSGR